MAIEDKKVEVTSKLPRKKKSDGAESDKPAANDSVLDYIPTSEPTVKDIDSSDIVF